MNRKTVLASITVGFVVGFIVGLVAYQPFHSVAQAQEKKIKKDPVVKQLDDVEKAISDRNSPVVKELEGIKKTMSDRNRPVVKVLGNMTDELKEIAEMKEDIDRIEGHLDDMK